jgi:hypothetical protein
MIIIFSFSVAPFIAWDQRLESRNSTVYGGKYLGFSPLAPSKREKNILVLLSLYIF